MARKPRNDKPWRRKDGQIEEVPPDDTPYDPNNPPPPPPPKKKCFISTLFVEILGKDDNCAELETLRWFRNQVMPTRWPGPLATYSIVGPAIVDAVRKLRQDQQMLLAEAHWTDIEKAVAAIKEGDFHEAVGIYKVMVETLAATLELKG